MVVRSQGMGHRTESLYQIKIIMYIFPFIIPLLQNIQPVCTDFSAKVFKEVIFIAGELTKCRFGPTDDIK